MLPVTRALLTQVASGQEQRNVSDTSIALYLSKMHVQHRPIKNVTSQLRHFKKQKKNSVQAEKLMSLFVFFMNMKLKCIAEVAPMRELD
jgi:hypothetical protein